MLISSAEVLRQLNSCFGADLVAVTTLPEDCTRLLRSWMPGLTTIRQLRGTLEDCLFNGFYAVLGPDMIFRPEKGIARRVVLSALPEAADRLMLPAFLSMSETAASFAQLKEFAMATGSTTAMYALYQRFAAFQTEGDLSVEQRILQEAGYPV